MATCDNQEFLETLVQPLQKNSWAPSIRRFRRLWSLDIGPGLAEALEAAFPSEWPDLVSTALSADLRFFVLLWQGRYAKAREYAARMAVLFRRMELPEGRWVERAGDAAFYDGEYIEARRRCEESLPLLTDPAQVYLKLSDIHFKLGPRARARLSREDLRESPPRIAARRIFALRRTAENVRRFPPNDQSEDLVAFLLCL